MSVFQQDTRRGISSNIAITGLKLAMKEKNALDSIAYILKIHKGQVDCTEGAT